jgi:CubicO group peptidase (beta-lactamase class C family)
MLPAFAARLDKRIEIPADLSRVTSYDPALEVEPRDVGMTRDGVESIWSAVERYYRTGVHPALSVCIRRHGQIVLRRAIGHARGNGPHDGPDAQKILATPETPICQYSASKAITAMLVHHLEQTGKIHLTDPVSWYLPEFAQHGKGDVTILHVLSHQSGIPRIPRGTAPELLFDFDAAVRLVCALPPAHPGGHDMSYHAVTGGFVLGELVRRVAGKPIDAYLDETMRGPLGLRFFRYGVADEDADQVAVNYETGLPVPFPFSAIMERALGGSFSEVVRISNDPRFLRAVIPAANLVATADEMSRFFQLLLAGGELDGVRIFDPLTLRRATIEAGKMRIDSTMVLLPMRYSAGFMLGASPFGMFGPDTRDAFGHWGFIKSFSWADPKRALAVSLLNTGKPFLGPHLYAHFDLLAKIAKHCPTVARAPVRLGSRPAPAPAADRAGVAVGAAAPH